MTTCATCPQGGATCQGQGPAHTPLVIVGEAPGRQEVIKGTPFIGPSGRLLDQTLKVCGMDRKDVYVTNTVMCRPTDKMGSDAPPTKEMMRACSSRLVADITSRSPKVVLAVGATAAQALCNTTDGITKIQGSLIWNAEIELYVLPTYHPAAVLHGQTGHYDAIFDDVQRAIRLAQGVVPLPDPNFVLPWRFLTQAGDIHEKLQQWIDRPPHKMATDTEAHTKYKNGPRPIEDRWLMTQFYDGVEAIALPMPLIMQVWELRQQFQELFLLPDISWVLHNLSYDAQVFKANDIQILIDNWRDTMCLGLGLTERGEQVGLKALSRSYLNEGYYEKELVESGYQWHVGPRNKADWYYLAKYGCRDVYNTYRLDEVLPPLVVAEGTMDCVRDLLLPAQRAFAGDPEFRGTYVDMDHVDTLRREWGPIIDEARRNLQSYAKEKGFRATDVSKNQQKGIVCPDCVGPITPAMFRAGQADEVARVAWRDMLARTEFGDPSCRRCMKRRFILVPDDDFNPNAAGQRQHLALNVLRMRPVRGRSVDKDFLAYHEHHPFSKLMGEYSERKHLMSNYVEGIADDVWSDGAIHPDFLLFGTLTGRLSIHNPPMQTIPKWGVDPKKAKLVRKLFKARPGFLICDVDYKNLELFIAWHYSKDANLGRALIESDFHTETASAIFATPYDQVTGFQRFNSKFVTFGVAYNRSAWSLAQGELKDLTGGSEARAQGFVDNFWGLYSDWKATYDGWQETALTTGELTTPMGRKRRWRLLTRDLERAIRSQAVNFPMQSLASDTCLSALIRLERRLPAEGLGHVLFTVHDSLVFEIREDRVDEAVAVIVEEMTAPPYPTHIKLFVDVEVGPSLGEVEPYVLPAAA